MIKRERKMKTLDIIIIAVIVAILTILVNRTYKDEIPNEIKRDTITKIIERKPTIIDKKRASIRIKKDSLIQTKPFVARIDTINKYDTISLTYDYPENTFSMTYSHKPDTTTTIREKQITEKEQSWYEAPLYILSGAAIAEIIRSIFK